MLSVVCLSVTRVFVTKQLQIGSRGFHCKVANGLTVGTVSLKTKFEGSPLDMGAQPVLGWLMTLPNCYCTLNTYIYRRITSGQRQPIVVIAVGVINVRRTAIHC